MSASVQNVASFFVHLPVFASGPIEFPSESKVGTGSMSSLFWNLMVFPLLGEKDSNIATALALNRSAHLRSGKG
jgi:hypothetical protein